MPLTRKHGRFTAGIIAFSVLLTSGCSIGSNKALTTAEKEAKATTEANLDRFLKSPSYAFETCKPSPVRDSIMRKDSDFSFMEADNAATEICRKVDKELAGKISQAKQKRWEFLQNQDQRYRESIPQPHLFCPPTGYADPRCANRGSTW